MMSIFLVFGGVRHSVMASLTSAINSSLTRLAVSFASCVSVQLVRDVCNRAISMKISSQLESAPFFNVSTAWFVSCGDGLRHFEKEIKNRSIRPCPWAISATRRAANGTCVAPSMEKGVFVEISRIFSVAYL